MRWNTDELLWEAIRQDNHRAFEILFVKYYPELRKLAYYYCGRYEDSEEIAADVLQKLWEKRKEIELHGTVRAYLMVSVRNATINILRRKIQAIEELTDTISAVEPDEYERPEHRLLLKDIEKEILHALDTLPERQKDIFRLHRLHSYTVQQIAGMMSITEGTVQTQLYKAVKKLKNYFMHRTGKPGKIYSYEKE